MSRKIYYITRSFFPFQKGGGPLMRKAAVDNFKSLGWDITVVMPNYNSDKYVNGKELIQIPLKFNKRFSILLEMIGIYEDYLDKWVKKSFLYLINIVKKDDIIFVSTGGELGTIKVGVLLKKELGCKLVINFRDPIVYTKVHNKHINKRFHVSRENQEKRYILDADLLITSSNSFKDNLLIKYPLLKGKIENNYFGYVSKIELGKTSYNKRNKLSIAYVGNMEVTQKPEILYEIYKDFIDKDRIKIYFIGEYKRYKPFKKIDDKNIEFLDYLPRDNFLKFMDEYIDVGFVSLSSDFLGACVPSKVYEYINLGIPMLGALPIGDGLDIINKNQFGVGYLYTDKIGLQNGLKMLLDEEFYNKCKKNILAQRDKWSMSKKILEVDAILKKKLNVE